MNIRLTPEETEILDKLLPTGSFTDHKRLQIAIRDAVKEKYGDGGNDPAEQERIRVLMHRYVTNIEGFLLEESFYGEREGHVYFLTEKGKHLRQQRSLEQYYAWKAKRGEQYKEDLKDIKGKGYLKQDELPQVEEEAKAYRKRKNLFYPILGVILIIIILAALHHNYPNYHFSSFKQSINGK